MLLFFHLAYDSRLIFIELKQLFCNCSDTGVQFDLERGLGSSLETDLGAFFESAEASTSINTSSTEPGSNFFQILKAKLI
jgi:hypothetical protein